MIRATHCRTCSPATPRPDRRIRSRRGCARDPCRCRPLRLRGGPPSRLGGCARRPPSARSAGLIGDAARPDLPAVVQQAAPAGRHDPMRPGPAAGPARFVRGKPLRRKLPHRRRTSDSDRSRTGRGRPPDPPGLSAGRHGAGRVHPGRPGPFVDRDELLGQARRDARHVRRQRLAARQLPLARPSVATGDRGDVRGPHGGADCLGRRRWVRCTRARHLAGRAGTRLPQPRCRAGRKLRAARCRGVRRASDVRVGHQARRGCPAGGGAGRDRQGRRGGLLRRCSPRWSRGRPEDRRRCLPGSAAGHGRGSTPARSGPGSPGSTALPSTPPAWPRSWAAASR